MNYLLQFIFGRFVLCDYVYDFFYSLEILKLILIQLYLTNTLLARYKSGIM